jgi:translation elongation factor EF-Tu-like GTPase
MPGDNLTVKLNLAFPLPISLGQRFAIREGGKTIAVQPTHGFVGWCNLEDPA